MKIRDIMEKNAPNFRVKVAGANSSDASDGRVEEYYDGCLSDVPKYLRDIEVLKIVWSIGADCNCILIPYISK